MRQPLIGCEGTAHGPLWEEQFSSRRSAIYHVILEVQRKWLKRLRACIKLQIPAGKATPAPPVGPALGQHGVNIMAFTKEFNERTKNDVGLIIPVVITVYADRSFTFVTKTPSCGSSD